MNLSADKIFEEYGKHCMLCVLNTPLPSEYEWTCIACG